MPRHHPVPREYSAAPVLMQGGDRVIRPRVMTVMMGRMMKVPNAMSVEAAGSGSDAHPV